jgi:hypothetical protein
MPSFPAVGRPRPPSGDCQSGKDADAAPFAVLAVGLCPQCETHDGPPMLGAAYECLAWHVCRATRRFTAPSTEIGPDPSTDRDEWTALTRRPAPTPL